MERPKEVQWFIDIAPSLANVWGPEVVAYLFALEAENDELHERLLEWRALGKPRDEE